MRQLTIALLLLAGALAPRDVGPTPLPTSTPTLVPATMDTPTPTLEPPPSTTQTPLVNAVPTPVHTLPATATPPATASTVTGHHRSA